MRSIAWSLILVATSAVAWNTRLDADENWSNWRGPHVNGVVKGDFPLHWSAEQNVVWKMSMISPAGSTPVVWGNRVFLTAAENGHNILQCVSLDGREIWRTKLGAQIAGKHKKGSGCNPSPVTDGKHVYVYYKSGQLACLDFEGRVVWDRNVHQDFAKDTLWWDLGTSPILTRDHLVVACVQSGPSYLAAFDLQTGDLCWKVDRMLDAPEEANQTYSTPLVVNRGNEQMLVVLGADHVTAHAATDGHELWRVGGMNPSQNGYFRSIASPVYTQGIVVAPYARGTTLTAIGLDGAVVWSDTEVSADVPTPAALDGYVFVCTDKGRLACVSATTGDILWEVSTGKHRSAFSSSPIIAGERIYLSREDGTVFVYELTGNHRLLATNSVGEFTVATPVFVDSRILIRTSDHLYCISSRAADRRRLIVR